MGGEVDVARALLVERERCAARAVVVQVEVARPDEVLRAVGGRPRAGNDVLERGRAAADVEAGAQLDGVEAGDIGGVYGVYAQRTGQRFEGDVAAFDVHVVGAEVAFFDGEGQIPVVDAEAGDRARLPRGADVERVVAVTAIVEVVYGEFFVRDDAARTSEGDVGAAKADVLRAHVHGGAVALERGHGECSGHVHGQRGAEAQRFLDGEVARGSQAQRALAAHEVAAVCKGADGGVAGEAEAQVVDLGAVVDAAQADRAGVGEDVEGKAEGAVQEDRAVCGEVDILACVDARGGLEAGERARREAVNAQGAAGAHGHAALRGFEGELAAGGEDVDGVGVHVDIPARGFEIEVAVIDDQFADGDVSGDGEAQIVIHLRVLAPEVELFGGEDALRVHFRRAADPDTAGDDVARDVDGGLVLADEVVKVDVASGKHGEMSARLHARLAAQVDVAAGLQRDGRKGGQAVFHGEVAISGEVQVAGNDAVKRDAGDAQVAAGPDVVGLGLDGEGDVADGHIAAGAQYGAVGGDVADGEAAILHVDVERHVQRPQLHARGRGVEVAFRHFEEELEVRVEYVAVLVEGGGVELAAHGNGERVFPRADGGEHGDLAEEDGKVVFGVDLHRRAALRAGERQVAIQPEGDVAAREALEGHILRIGVVLGGVDKLDVHIARRFDDAHGRDRVAGGTQRQRRPDVAGGIKGLDAVRQHGDVESLRFRSDVGGVADGDAVCVDGRARLLGEIAGSAVPDGLEALGGHVAAQVQSAAGVVDDAEAGIAGFGDDLIVVFADVLDKGAAAKVRALEDEVFCGVVGDGDVAAVVDDVFKAVLKRHLAADADHVGGVLQYVFERVGVRGSGYFDTLAALARARIPAVAVDGNAYVVFAALIEASALGAPPGDLLIEGVVAVRRVGVIDALGDVAPYVEVGIAAGDDLHRA